MKVPYFLTDQIARVADSGELLRVVRWRGREFNFSTQRWLMGRTIRFLVAPNNPGLAIPRGLVGGDCDVRCGLHRVQVLGLFPILEDRYATILLLTVH